MFGAIGLEEVVLASTIKMESYTLRKLMEIRTESNLHTKLVDRELGRRGILDKLRRRKPEWFI
jgi:hypothetical protein